MSLHFCILNCGNFHEPPSEFQYFVTHTSYWLSYMHLLSHFPSSLSLSWRGAEEEEAGLAVVVPGVELTKVGHGYSPSPLFPLETPWICTLAGNPTGLCSFSISALYSFSYLCTFLFLSLSALHFYCGLSLSFLAMSLVCSSASVCGDDFLLDTISNFFHCHPLTTDFAYSAVSLSALLFKRTNSCSDPFSLPLSLNFFVFCSSSLVQGGPDAP